MEDFQGKYDGKQIESRLDKVKDMVGATASAAGAAGLVPAPAKGDENKFLSGDGMWKDVVVEKVNADWNATEGDALILNKPTIPTVDVNKEYVDTQLATKSDLPDYTVFNIVFAILSMDAPYVISQEDYNYLISVMELDEIPYGFDIPTQSYGIYSLTGSKNDNGIKIMIKTVEDIGAVYMMQQCVISPDLSVLITTGIGSMAVVDNGIVIASDILETDGSVKQDSVTIETKGDKDKSLMADGKYRKLPVYGRNLLLGSGKEVSNPNYNIANYWLTEQIQKGAQVTVTIWGELGEGTTGFALFNSGGMVPAGNPQPVITPINGKGTATFYWNITNNSGNIAKNTFLEIYCSPLGNTPTNPSTIHKIKLEYGDLSTEWTPAWEDIPDIEERYAYGVEWDMASSSPDGKRVGNMQLHRELPVQSGMRRCILDNNGGVVMYDTEKLEEGYSEITNFASMTRIPQHWYKMYFNGTRFRMMLSEIPLPGYKCVNEFYISTTEARLDRDSMILCSCYSVGSSTGSARGGDNTAEWDGTYRSLLGCPVTNLTRDQFRQAARKRGSGWEMYTYNAHKTLFWLFAVEYATLDSQKPFNAQKDANGFAQGGLGPGPTQMPDWPNFNNANPLIPCGYTKEFGNGSGEKAYVVKNASGGTHATLMANRYRGIENPFGHIWKYTDGANIQVTTGDAGLSILWTTDDPSNFSDTSYTGYDKKGNICRTNGYAKKMLLGEDGDIVATEVGGSTSTYWCDSYYTNTSANRMQVIQVGGDAGNGVNAGLADVYTHNAPSTAYRHLGSRLCFFPEYRKTSA